MAAALEAEKASWRGEDLCTISVSTNFHPLRLSGMASASGGDEGLDAAAGEDAVDEDDDGLAVALVDLLKL